MNNLLLYGLIFFSFGSINVYTLETQDKSLENESPYFLLTCFFLYFCLNLHLYNHNPEYTLNINITLKLNSLISLYEK